MKIFALGDLHFSFEQQVVSPLENNKQYKPMDCFGEKWENHFVKIHDNWRQQVKKNDTVLIPGDISWAMKLQEVVYDLNFLQLLPGKKIIVKGNHDYWWNSINKVREILPENCYAIQNDSILVNSTAIAGTRGWKVPGVEDLKEQEFTEHDHKVFLREVHRLQLSLESIDREYNKLIVMFHYMPVNAGHEKNEMIEVLKDYEVDFCIYGHLHDEEAHQLALQGEKWGIDFKLVSADYLDFTPGLIVEE